MNVYRQIAAAVSQVAWPPAPADRVSRSSPRFVSPGWSGCSLSLASRPTPWFGTFAAALAFALGLGASDARANACVWTGTTGSWSTAANWTGCASVAPGAGDDVTINAGTATLAANTTVNSLSGTGGTLNLSTFTLTLAGASSTSTASIISGSGKLTKNGSGTQSLTGANTYTGATTVSGGILSVGAGSTTGSISSSSGVTVTSPGILQFNLSNALTFAKVIAGSGGVTQAGTGTTSLSGVNTYVGATSVTAGVLSIGAGGTTGSLSTSSGVTVTAPGTLQFNRTNALAFSNVIANTGAIKQAGTGTTTLSGANTYSGTTTVSAGVLKAGVATSAFGTNSAVTVTAGSLDLGGFSQSIGSLAGAGTVTSSVAGAVTLTTGVLNTSTSFSGVLQNGSGTVALTQAGSATLSLSGANTYTGATTVSAGTLSIGAGGTTGSLSASSAVSVTGTLQFNRTNAFTFGNAIGGGGAVKQVGAGGTTTLSGANSYSGTTTVSAGTLALGVNNAIPSASAVTVVAATTLSLAGFSQSLSNGITASGTLALGSNGSLSVTASTSTLAAITGSGSLTVGSGATATLSAAVANSSVNIALAGGTLNLGNFTHSLGTLSLSANSTLDFGSGSASLGLSTLTLGSASLASTHWALGSSHLVAAAITTNPAKDTANVSPLNQITLGSFAPSQTVWSSANNELVVTGGTYWDTTPGNGAVDGGTGTWDATSANWTTSTGTPNGAWAGGTNTAVFQGSAGTATLANGYTASVGGLSFGTSGYTVAAAGSGALNLAGAATITTSGATSTATISAPIGGANPLATAGAGTLTLTGTSTYSGATTVGAGTLIVGTGTSGSINMSPSAALAAGATLQFSRTDTASFTPSVSGTGVLVQAGSGTTVLTGTNTFSGGTTLQAGTLNIANSSKIGTGPITFAGSATLTTTGVGGTFSNPWVINTGVTGTVFLAFVGSFPTFSGNISGAGTWIQTNYGVWLSGDNSGFTGNATFTNSAVFGTLSSAFPSASSLVVEQVRLAAVGGGTYDFADLSAGGGGWGGISTTAAGTHTLRVGSANASHDLSARPMTDGTGILALTKVGIGTYTLTAANTYSGATAVNGGTLAINGSTSATSTVSVAAGATLAGTGTAAGTVSVAGILSPGTGASGSAGTLSTGTLVIASGASVAIKLGAPGTTGGGVSDLVQVTGDLTLDGALNIAALTGFSPTSKYTLFTYTGTRSGTFASNNLAASGYQGVIEYNDTLKQVNLLPPPLVRAAEVSNGGTDTFAFQQSGLGNATLSVSTTTSGVAATSGPLAGSIAGAASLTQVAAAGWSGTLVSVSCIDANGATDGNGIGNLGTLTGSVLSLPAGVMKAGADITCTFTNTLNAVRGVVFNDGGAPGGGVNTGTPNDGLQNGAEVGVYGVTVSLNNCVGTTFSSMSTDTTGAYSLAIPSAQVGLNVCVSATLPSGAMATGANAAGTALPPGTAVAVSGVSYTYTRSSQQVSFTAPAGGGSALNFAQVPVSSLQANSSRSGMPGVNVLHPHLFTAGSGGSLQLTLGAATATPAIPGWSEVLYQDPGCTGGVQPGATRLFAPAVALTVTQGQIVCFVVQEFLPAAAGNGSSNVVPVLAVLSLSNATGTLTSSLNLADTTVVNTTSVALLKEVRNVTQGGSFGMSNQARSGDTVEYRITYTNLSPTAVNGLLITDYVSSFASFMGASAGPLPNALTACTKNTPANPMPAAAVLCGTVQTTGGSGTVSWQFSGALSPGASGSVLFSVTVN